MLRDMTSFEQPAESFQILSYNYDVSTHTFKHAQQSPVNHRGFTTRPEPNLRLHAGCSPTAIRADIQWQHRSPS